MVGEGGDWYMGSEMVTTSVFESLLGSKLAWRVFHFWDQDWVTLDWFRQFTASQPLQCVIVSIMNGCASWRFGFIKYNHHHTVTFGSWAETISVEGPYCFTLRLCVFKLIQQFHSSLTLPMSHYKYNEWLEKVEIGIWALKWSPQVFLSRCWG